MRSRRIEIQEVAISGQFNETNCVLLPGDNSQSFALTPSIVSNYEMYKSYNCRVEGDNVSSVAVEGQFILDALELTFSLGAAR